tara:strand:- start:433 stop:687 length:255 start_codon:yes stop_codon:yes gene_type:complete
LEDPEKITFDPVGEDGKESSKKGTGNEIKETASSLFVTERVEKDGKRKRNEDGQEGEEEEGSKRRKAEGGDENKAYVDDTEGKD